MTTMESYMGGESPVPEMIRRELAKMASPEKQQQWISKAMQEPKHKKNFSRAPHINDKQHLIPIVERQLSKQLHPGVG